MGYIGSYCRQGTIIMRIPIHNFAMNIINTQAMMKFCCFTLGTLLQAEQ